MILGFWVILGVGDLGGLGAGVPKCCYSVLTGTSRIGLRSGELENWPLFRIIGNLAQLRRYGLKQHL